MKLLPFGDRAFLAELEDLPQTLAFYARLRKSRPDGVTDLVPAARTVLVRHDPAVLSQPAAREWALRCARTNDGAAAPTSAGRTVVIDVEYAGPDLAEVGKLLGLTPPQVVAFHTGTPWTAAFTGFAPGFAYLVPQGKELDVPRRTSPRTAVPAGSVGLAGGFSGVYPRSSPGGWQLIGTTRAQLWDESSDQPALITPGSTVRFRAV